MQFLQVKKYQINSKEDLKRAQHEQDQLEFNSKENAISELQLNEEILRVVSDLFASRNARGKTFEAATIVISENCYSLYCYNLGQFKVQNYHCF